MGTDKNRRGIDLIRGSPLPKERKRLREKDALMN